ncbi:MAG: 2Fe-2S iron-sulfur cluster-binding protein [Campylobacterota bacterium]|nr:2Fe-2S iron-sulfur cluster-binding protein [Campylobacterota bacterium]
MQNIIICDKQYSIETRVDNLLVILNQIKTTQNSSLAYRSGCRSGVCGSCAVTVNGAEKLACKTHIKDGDIITPLKNSEVIKDLVVDISTQERFLKKAKASLDTKSDTVITSQDEKNIDVESNCILCNSCFSSCPIYEVNQDFIGPFALTRNYRYIDDKKESENGVKDKIDVVQKNGIWDCTLCGNCNMVCPAHIDIKGDIMKLRNKSAQFGYNDPNFTNNNIGFDTNLDFGFNPNGF